MSFHTGTAPTATGSATAVQSSGAEVSTEEG